MKLMSKRCRSDVERRVSKAMSKTMLSYQSNVEEMSKQMSKRYTNDHVLYSNFFYFYYFYILLFLLLVLFTSTSSFFVSSQLGYHNLLPTYWIFLRSWSWSYWSCWSPEVVEAIFYLCLGFGLVFFRIRDANAYGVKLGAFLFELLGNEEWKCSWLLGLLGLLGLLDLLGILWIFFFSRASYTYAVTHVTHVTRIPQL